MEQAQAVMQCERPGTRVRPRLAAGLLYAVAMYGGAYVLAASPSPLLASAFRNWPFARRVRYDVLLVPATLVGAFFSPAHWVDRRLRPELW